MAKVLIVDDEPAILTLLEYQVGKLGYEVVSAVDGDTALAALAQHQPDAVLLDVNLPGRDGIAVLDELRAVDPALPVIMMTAVYLGGRGVADGMSSVQTAVRAMSHGAFDYVLKPADEFLDKVRLSLRNAVRQRQAPPAPPAPASPPAATTPAAEDGVPRPAFANLIGDSPAMREVYEVTQKVLDTSATVLVLGESGTGKELVARAIHDGSRRSAHELVILNCAAITETLLEAELFGHEKGAFTGAVARKLGKFEAADGGTIFLDEIGDMPLSTQAKVLRVLQEREIVRVGGTERITVDVRVIAATHRDLEAMVRAGRFREDLYYRLSVFPINLPPLRRRVADIPLLAAWFVHRFAQAEGRTLDGMSEAAIDALCRHPWPGNVRELENALLRAVILAEGPRIERSDLPPAVRGEVASSQTLAAVEATAIRRMLESAGGDVPAAAHRLGLSVAELRERAASHDIELGST
ncbi:MAG: sigma-54-dependent Fis family transcriptional regulator [Armatimonadetes bacterium]|nr:sigma-54-dependent Fis family transcriptional regulator [Armatimonadota bacterium]